MDLWQQTLEENFLECNFPNYISSKYKDILLKYYDIRDINMDIIEVIKKLKNNSYNIYVLSDIIVLEVANQIVNYLNKI